MIPKITTAIIKWLKSFGAKEAAWDKLKDKLNANWEADLKPQITKAMLNALSKEKGDRLPRLIKAEVVGKVDESICRFIYSNILKKCHGRIVRSA